MRLNQAKCVTIGQRQQTLEKVKPQFGGVTYPAGGVCLESACSARGSCSGCRGECARRSVPGECACFARGEVPGGVCLESVPALLASVLESLLLSQLAGD